MKNKIFKVILSIIIALIATFIKTDLILVKTFLYIISYIIVGSDVLKEAILNIFKGNFFDENFLMTVATIGAICIKEFPEAVSVMIFYNIGEIFELLGEEKSKKSISSLMDIRQDFANVKNESGKIETKRPEDVLVGDIIVVKPGEKVPLDGVIIDGKGLLDMSALTGESLPVEIKNGEEILSGSINLNSIITIKVTKVYKESAVSKILDLLQNATDKKAKTENFITKFSKIYTPSVIFLAIFIFLFGLISKIGTIDKWLYMALTFLVISCPCALVISVPLSFFSGIGLASKKGILIKGSCYMDILSKVDTIVFDKTGTLTTGTFEVEDVVAENIDKEKLIEYAAMAEYYSNHPVANAIKRLYKKDTNFANRIKDLEEVLGKGIKCTIDKKKVIVGNKKFLEENNIKIGSKKSFEDEIEIYVGIDNNYVGKIIIADAIKEESLNIVENLKKVGIKNTVMLTGDKSNVAKRVAEKIKIDKVYSNLLPNEKIEKLEDLIKHNKANNLGKIAYVGDGINDSPVLARADIGISMGQIGSDAAVEASDVVIMKDSLDKIISAIKISKKTVFIAKENIILAISIKVIILILSLLGLTSMWMAVFADVGVTIIAVLNALRIGTIKV